MNLSELVRLSNEIRLSLIESGGEITEHIQKDLMVVEKNLPAKVDAYKFIIDDIENEAAMWKERSDEFLRVSKTHKKFIEKLKENLKLACQAQQVDELIGVMYKWKLQNAKASVIIENEELVPSKYKTVVQTFQVDKEKIAADLAKGIPVEGCRLEASTYMKPYPNSKRG